MGIKIRVVASGTIPTKQYGNYIPTVELEEDFNSNDLEKIEERTRQLRSVAENLYAERDGVFRSIMEKKQSRDESSEAPTDEPTAFDPPKKKEFKIRWTEGVKEDGAPFKYPSVTSILNPYGLELTESMVEMGMTLEDIDMYALRGTIVHDQAEHFVKTGEWKSMELHPDYEKVKNYRSAFITDKNALLPDKCNLKGFIEKYWSSFEFKESEVKVINHELEYAGTMDANGSVLIDDRLVPAIIDFKTGSSYPQDKRDDYFMQMAAYDLGSGAKAQAYVIIPLTPKNKCGYSAPIVTTEVEKYREMFMAKKAEFDQLLKDNQ